MACCGLIVNTPTLRAAHQCFSVSLTSPAGMPQTKPCFVRLRTKMSRIRTNNAMIINPSTTHNVYLLPHAFTRVDLITNCPLKENTPTYGGGWTASGMSDDRHFPPPPNTFHHHSASRPRTPPTSPFKSKRAKEAQQWSRQRNANGETYYFNSVTNEWQIEIPDCLKKYTNK